jgi:hypothetical protein
MDANIIVGSAVLALALAMGGFLAVALFSAGDVGEPRASRTSYGVRTRGAFPRPDKGLSAGSTPARCYYDCMSAFHWTADWGSLCGEACGTDAGLPRG